MSNLNETRVELAAKLTANGVDTSLDPGCDLPAVLIGSPTVLASEGIGGWTVEYPIQIMSTPPGNAAALEWMLDQLETVLTVYFGPAVPRTIEHIGKEVPAYVITVTRSVSNPTC